MHLIFFSSVPYGNSYIDFFIKRGIVLKSVITSAPKKAGRGLKLRVSPVSLYSKKLGISVIEVNNLKEIKEDIKSMDVDLGVVVGFGKYIPEEIYSIPRFGTFNIHFSYLPYLRGPAPVEWAILEGYKETGVTIFKLNKDIDTGDIYLREKVSILPDETKEELLLKLIDRSFYMLEEFLNRIEKMDFKVIKQEGRYSFAPKIKKEDAFISWEESSIRLLRKIRALNPYPGCYTFLPDGKILKILKATPYPASKETSFVPGTVSFVVKGKGFVVGCKDGSFLIERVKLQGKKEMTAMEFIRGRMWLVGKILGKK